MSASQENDEFTPSLPEINPITGAEIDPQFGDAFSHRFDIAGIASSQTLDSGLNSRTRLQIAQSVEPFGENVGFPNLDHG